MEGKSRCQGERRLWREGEEGREGKGTAPSPCPQL